MSAKAALSRPRRAYSVAFAHVLGTFIVAISSGSVVAAQKEYEYGNEATNAATVTKPMVLKNGQAGFISEMPKTCPEECNHNGKCNDKGVCDCFPGYTGAACNNLCPNLCSGQGKCTDGRCLCLAGFVGVDCSLKACCSGHGDCTIPGSCTCDPGWMGDQCQVGMSCPDPSCSGHGSCNEGNCACTAGFNGVTCANPPEECGPCPPGGECDREAGICLCLGVPCAKKPGVAKKDRPATKGGSRGAGGGVAGALGDSAFGMLGEDAPAAGDQDSDDYAGAGTDGTDTGGGGDGVDVAKANMKRKQRETTGRVTLHPGCNPPHGHWNSTVSLCDCEFKWYGESCEHMHCSDWDEDSGNPDCSGRGMCSGGECFCAAGWGLVPGGVGANVCKDPVCPVDCGPHGICNENMCVCQDGWQGQACREPKCDGDCSGHGTCTFVVADSPAECVCEFGFSPPNCQDLALYQNLDKCPNECSGQGLCMKGVCVCMEGTTGLDCSREVCRQGSSGPSCQYKSCPRDCSGYGVCFNGECACDDAHLGPDCSIPMKCYEACHNVCLADLAGSRCGFCKGQCLALTSHPIVGEHDPLLARLYALPQMSSHHPAAQAKQTQQ